MARSGENRTELAAHESRAKNADAHSFSLWVLLRLAMKSCRLPRGRLGSDAKPASLQRSGSQAVKRQFLLRPSRQSNERQAEKKINCRRQQADADVVVIG